MDYKTLMAKLAAYELKQKIKKVEPKPAPVVEETPHEIEIKAEVTETLMEESEKVENINNNDKCDEVEVVTITSKKKNSGKKPANRAYMVVENIDEVNKK